jgi:uncharacterized protein
MKIARAVLLTLLMCWAWAAAAEVAVPALTGRVVDQTGALSGSDIVALTQKLKDLEGRKGSQIAVLIVPTTAPETIKQFSIRVAEAWKIGRKKIDDGALLVVAKNDRQLRIEVGYGLEGSLADATIHRIIDEIITPKFKAGDFAGGISAGISRMIAVIDGEALPAPSIDIGGWLVTGFKWLLVGFVGLWGFVGIIFGFVGRPVPTSGGGWRWRRSSGVHWQWRGSGLATGFSDRSSRDSSSESDNFSGGGGSFGGGGASGKW